MSNLSVGKFHNNPLQTHRNKGPQTCHFCPRKVMPDRTACHWDTFLFIIGKFVALISMSLQQIIITILCKFTKSGIVNVN